MSDNDINQPTGVNNSALVMVISSSPVYSDTLKSYLLDFDYKVAGPFENVDQGNTFLRETRPDLILFDAITTQSELITYSTMLRNEAQDIPTLVLHSGENFSISHTKIEFIFPPINPTNLKQKITSLLDPDEGEISTASAFVDFVNQTIMMIVELAPEFALVDIKEILNEAVTTLSEKNSEIATLSEETLKLQIKEDNLSVEDFAISFEVLLKDVIKKINERMEAEWGESLIEDALEAVTIKFKTLPEPAIDIVKRLGKGYTKVIKKFKYAVPDFDSLDKNIVVAKLLLTDWGPELKEKIATDSSLGKDFDENLASQLITLVGQGSNYHEGLYGPVPIPRSDDVIAIIWSKLIESDIRDERMGGKTLVIITIGFRQTLLNSIPPREKLHSIFDEVEEFDHEKKITKLTLEKIAEKFHGHLT